MCKHTYARHFSGLVKYPLTTMSNAQEQLTFQPLTLAVSDDLGWLVMHASATNHGQALVFADVHYIFVFVEVISQLDTLPC